MKFTKMHGCGNDYVYVNLLEEKIDNFEEMAIKVSNRNFGIGSDGLIMIAESDVADYRMIMYNADGSRGAMCGNGIRCVAKYIYDHKMTDKNVIDVETDSGIKTLEIFAEDGVAKSVKVNMGAPILEPKKIPVNFDCEKVISEPINVNGREYKITAVSMGNPHGVVFMDPSFDLKGFEIEEIGPYFEKHELFPDRINTEFIVVNNRNDISMRVWERGSGETLACGTGACASVVAAFLNGFTERKVVVHLLGGDLNIEYSEDGNVYMTGPAVTSFEGEFFE